MKNRSLTAISRELSAAVDGLRFGEPIAYVYNPLAYARAPHESYLTRYGVGTGRILLLGMNPGPFGMAQTGVPFGDVAMVRDFLGIDAPVGRPAREHPSRPVRGFACPRSEVSGTRLWGWARDRYGKASAFFERFFVINYCPLVFMEASGRNLTPDKLPPDEQEPLVAACDRAILQMAELLEPSLVVGIGGYAESAARRALKLPKGAVGNILHPSPANPKANSGWSKIVEGQLRDLGVKL
jgi:single-strand selective monofunctional uracil DNA glycosylase